MANNWSLCGACYSRHLIKPSEVWCSECNAGLCRGCKKHHSVSKDTQNHTVEYKKLPTEVVQIAQVCKIHKERYELFCRKHDCPCCKICGITHNDCESLFDINEYTKNVKTSNAFREIEKTLLEVVNNIKRIITNREDNLESLKNKEKEIENVIKQIRTRINKHLDQLQDDLILNLMEIEQLENSKIQKLLTALKNQEEEITEYQENFTIIKQHASELQIFLAMKNLEKDIAVKEQFIESITKSDSMNQVNISCQVNQLSLQEMTASVQRCVKINVSSNPCDLSIQKQKDRQAQISVAHSTRKIDSLTLTLQNHINTGLKNVRGCSLLPGGRMVFSCFSQNKLSVFKSVGLQDFEIKNIADTFDVVYIGNDCIAVSSGKSFPINVINIKKNKREKTIKVSTFSDGVKYNDGVAYIDGNLIYCGREEGLPMISCFDGSVTNIVSNNALSYASYVSTFRNKLFYTIHRDDSVTCCDFQGKILWTFSDASVLKTPLGISTDNNGNVFVAGANTDNVIVFSPDGKRYRELLSHEDGLIRPQVLHYDTSTDKLLVANEKNDAFLYDVK
ncbi:unnamed protein product [Mytilus coruscus]|uniref:B box-type domain-containing protein n=1 Tax=Mytilus coruscus TaxID=42192 RepID=A0A6J8ETV6_MYTCO|nr:unnamed protein product [Mytilus coruscus]